jgi:hypothetical protein
MGWPALNCWSTSDIRASRWDWDSGEAVAAVDVEHRSGDESVAHHRGEGLGDVVGSSDSAGGEAFGRVGEGCLFVHRYLVPDRGVHPSGEITFTRMGASSIASPEASDSSSPLAAARIVFDPFGR